MPDYIIKKRVNAQNMTEAIKLEKSATVEEVWIEKNEGNQQTTAIGFDL